MKTSVWVGLVLGALAEGGCGDRVALGSLDIELTLVPKSANIAVFQRDYTGAQDAANSLSGPPEAKVGVEYDPPSAFESDLQQAVIREAIAAKKDGLIVSCIDNTVEEAIHQAVAAGIPVITYDSDCAGSDRLGFYSMNGLETGAKAADLLVAAMAAMGAGMKRVAVLDGGLGSVNLGDRAAGFKDRLEELYRDDIEEGIVKAACNEDSHECAQVLEKLVAQNPDLNGLLVLGPWPFTAGCTQSGAAWDCTNNLELPTWAAASRLGLKTVAYDTLPIELELVRQGYISALIGQNYYGWGYDTVHLMVNHLRNGTPIPKFVDSGFQVACLNNVEDMQSRWETNDFRTPLSPPCELP